MFDDHFMLMEYGKGKKKKVGAASGVFSFFFLFFVLVRRRLADTYGLFIIWFIYQ